MEIRTANLNDVFIIATIVIRSWKKAYESIMPQTFLNTLSIEKKADSIREKMLIPNWQVFFIISDNGQDIGSVKLRFSKVKEIEYGEIAGFYFLPEYIHKGYGTRTLQYLEKYLHQKGFTYAFLWILSENKISIAFAEKNGYKYNGEEKTMEIAHRQTLKKYIKKL